MLLASCSHSRITPSEVVVTAQTEVTTCDSLGSSATVLLNVQKHGSQKFRLGVNGTTGPPFSLNWLYYDILSDASGTMAIHEDRMDAGYRPLPNAHVSVNRSSNTEFLVHIGNLSPAAHTKMFQVAIKDLEGGSFLSQPFRLCDHSQPNFAFQRNTPAGAGVSAELGC